MDFLTTGKRLFIISASVFCLDSVVTVKKFRLRDGGSSLQHSFELNNEYEFSAAHA